MIKILVCRVLTRRNNAAFVVNFHCATNAHFQKKTTGYQVGKLESLLRIVGLARKKPSSKANSSQHMLSQEKMLSQFLVLRLPFHCFVHERTCFILSPRVLIIYLHESSLLTSASRLP